MTASPLRSGAKGESLYSSVSCVRYLSTMRGSSPEKWTMHFLRGILSTSASSSSGRPSDWYDDCAESLLPMIRALTVSLTVCS